MLHVNIKAYVSFSLSAWGLVGCRLNFPFRLLPGMPPSSVWWHHAVKGLCVCLFLLCVVWCVFLSVKVISASLSSGRV